MVASTRKRPVESPEWRERPVRWAQAVPSGLRITHAVHAKGCAQDGGCGQRFTKLAFPQPAAQRTPRMAAVAADYSSSIPGRALKVDSRVIRTKSAIQGRCATSGVLAIYKCACSPCSVTGFAVTYPFSR